MNENTKDWGPYYSVLGEFVVNFENIVFAIREDSTFLLESRGLKDPILGEIIFGQRYLTAEPLISCYMTMVNHIIRYSNGRVEISKRLDEFKKKFSKLIESRNDIVHSTHFFVTSTTIVGPKNIRHEFKAYKPSPKKTGYHLKKTPKPQIVEYIEELKDLQQELTKFVNDLHKFLIDQNL